MAGLLEDFDITKEEIDNIGQALKKEEFRKLLVEYCEEVTSPAARKKYEEDIIQLEKERGVEVTFIHPTSGYVIKTSVGGNKIAFINVCSNDLIQQPSTKPSTKDGAKGINWSVPHILSPPREDMSKRGKRCTVYDVIFHPDALKLATKSAQFRDLINSIACEAIETNYSVSLDNTNLKFPKLKYKGLDRPLVIRKKTGEVPDVNMDDPIDKMYSEIYKNIDEKTKTPSKKTKVTENSIKSKYTTPKYLIKHRSDVDMQNFTNDTNAHINATVPKELVVEIDLPLLKTSSDLVLDVTEKSISLISEKPSKYKLNINLPYTINEENGNAKFDQDRRKLIITLPVKRKCNLILTDISRDDSGVDSDNNSPVNESSLDNSLPLIEELNIENSENGDSLTADTKEFYRTSDVVNFLDSELHYSLPEYSCHMFNNTLVFTLHVKNVDPSSLDNNYKENDSDLHVKFSSVSPAFVTVNYAFYLHLPLHKIDSESISIEVWDNNVVAQLSYNPSDVILTSYWAGLTKDGIKEKLIEEPSVIFNNHFNKLDEDDDEDNETDDSPKVQINVKSETDVSVVINPVTETDIQESISEALPVETDITQNIKSRSYSESSGDELSVSPTKGILKFRSRTPVSRSVSESSIDDYTWSSFENCASVSDSLIPEESETSSSMKKTVRFNDVVSQQLFRTNSSILGQKKKNQRKSRNKCRARERRLSESENSEGEDKKDKFKKNPGKSQENKKINEIPNSDGKEKSNANFKNDLIFDIDI